MRTTPACQLLAIATALCAVMLLGACKTTNSSWRKEEIGTDWEKRTLGKVTQAQKQLDAVKNGEDSEGYMSNEFDMASDVNTKTSLFGKKEARTKDYRTKDFAGSADEYKSDDYQFLKRQNFKEKSFAEQDDTYATGEASDNKRRFFGRNKRARTKDFAEGNDRFKTGDYKVSSGSPSIVDDQASEAGASLSVDDVRTILHGE